MRQRTAPAERHGQAGDKAFKGHQPLLHGNIAVARMDDLPAIMALLGKGAAEGSLVARKESEVAADIRLGGAFVHRKQGGIGGMVFLSVYSAALAEIRSFYVDEKGNGTGRALVEAALGTAEKLGIREALAITKQENEGVFSRFGFGKRSGFQTALFRKKGACNDIYDREQVQNATLQDMGDLLQLMDRGETEGKLIPRSRGEILADMRSGNAFVYRQHGIGEILGMAFLSVYSNRLAEIRNLYVRVQEAESLLVGNLAWRGDLLGVNEIMAIVKNGNGLAFMGQGFAQELHGFRIAMFRELQGG
ncbi:MAG: hypothetical protein PHV13_04270 [Candidatus ainarchaeum sp.]|nr:hypothetical protein [Candidatus ainarchaeum sp.]